ncbi:OST-HTH/LOTUS domain-containing protein [Microbacterium sp. NPDC057407]|uniref:OST-HTH/LOTUS domain-containing protein n=1 Tax=Microbacterium sp. NPDC057407 TaxID=3346120 RepID=UPI00366E4845
MPKIAAGAASTWHINLRASVAAASDEEGWAHLAEVGSLMRKNQPDFDSRNWGYAKLSDLVREIGLFAVSPNPPGGLRVKNGLK